MDEVYPDLLIGGLQEAVRADKSAVDRVVTVCQDPIEDNVPDDTVYSHYNMADGPAGSLRDGESSFALFESAADEVYRALVGGERVILHCHAGVSRSVSVGAAAVGRIKEEPYLGVLSEFRNIRPRVGPNAVQGGYAKHYIHKKVGVGMVEREMLDEIVERYERRLNNAFGRSRNNTRTNPFDGRDISFGNESTLRNRPDETDYLPDEIAYLPDEHNPLDVVRSELKEARKEVRSEYDWIRDRREHHGGGDHITQEHHKDECPERE